MYWKYIKNKKQEKPFLNFTKMRKTFWQLDTFSKNEKKTFSEKDSFLENEKTFSENGKILTTSLSKAVI